jgi:hypothetical protein
MLTDVYSDVPVSRARVFEQNKRFVGGREHRVNDDPKSGHHTTMKKQ